jgi:tRNA(fMet)-specific endonuclease VapC
MLYLLDTNLCIEILRWRNPALKSQIASKRLQDLTLCTIVWAELHYGAKLVRNPEAERTNLINQFGHWTKLPFNEKAAVRYGEIRAHLKNAGQMIGANDMLVKSREIVPALRKQLNTADREQLREFAETSITANFWQISVH